MAKVAAYRVDTGEKVWVPEHFLEHPKFGKAFRKTPRQKAADKAGGDQAPATDKTPATGDTTKGK